MSVYCLRTISIYFNYIFISTHNDSLMSFILEKMKIEASVFILIKDRINAL